MESINVNSAESPISIEVDYIPFINFAMHQNAVPLLKTIKINNNLDHFINEIGIRIWCEPQVFIESKMSIESIGPGSFYSIKNLDIPLMRSPLRKQVEREQGHLWVEINADGISQFRKVYPLTVLAYNEWYGISSLPEILAAHVLPNDRVVEHILKDAAKILLVQTGDSSLSGYQKGDRRRVFQQLAAIYYAVAKQKINYINPPASFESTGQKIRTPENMVNSKLATCLDTTVLLSACFEQAGLRPIVIMVDQHALSGVWLVDKSFDNSVIKHASMIINRIDLNELRVIESTGITHAKPLDINIALDQGESRLSDEEHFHYAIDISVARKMGILPLSISEIGSEEDSKEDDLNNNSYNIPIDLSRTVEIEGIEDDTSVNTNKNTESSADRLARWKTSLLDLTLRNRLLNFKNTRKSISLLCSNIAKLEDKLANNEEFRVRPKPESWGESDPRNATLHKSHTGVDAIEDYLYSEMDQHRLFASLSKEELKPRLTQIERDVRLGFEEGGANTLYLVLGFLVWSEDKGGEEEYRAPILLIPMKIKRQSLNGEFSIQRIDEESRINITLIHKLKVDYGISIEGLDPLPEDDSGLDVHRILQTIRQSIKRMPRWKVVEDVSLSILTFSRFLMWLDLEANSEILKKNAIVHHLIENSNSQFNTEANIPDIDSLDETYHPSKTFCPLHADSSQLRAVFAAAEGHTFILQGPPGTGKSQTITNLIAHCLSIGKRVLFVAQKKAALDVVHKRLAEVGLGPFCLELHSNKTTKDSFRMQLREALQVSGNRYNERQDAELNHLAELRIMLNEYVRDLHMQRAFGKSAYWIISCLIGHEGKPKILLDLGKTEDRSTEEYKRMSNAVKDIAEASKIAGNPYGHPLSAVRLTNWTYGIEDSFHTVINSAKIAYEKFNRLALSLLPDLSIDVSVASRFDCKLAGDLTSMLEEAPVVTKAIFTDADWSILKNEVNNVIEVGRSCTEKRSNLKNTYNDSVFLLDLPGLIEISRSMGNVWFLKRWYLRALIRKIVQSVRKDHKKPKHLEIAERDLDEALSVVENIKYFEKKMSTMSRLLTPYWNGLDSNWDDLKRIVDYLDRFHAILNCAPGSDVDAKIKTRKSWISIITEGRSIFLKGSSIGQKGQLYRDSLFEYLKHVDLLNETMKLDLTVAWGTEDDAKFLKRAETTLTNLSKNLSRLREWTHYQSSRADIIKQNLMELALALELGEINEQQLNETFENSFADWWVRKVLKNISSLAGFIGEKHEFKIHEFRDHEARAAELIRKDIYDRIASALPLKAVSNQRSLSSSEVGILHRFSQGGRKTIRRMFLECPNSLSKYKPCVLMSPLSVAQFIGVDFPKFDVVVFDEASQIPTYEAIGAIARGNQLIVVGDSRQLPPTTFFERQKSDEEDIEDSLPEELESILDESEAAGIKHIRLDWHYRSRHESLIAFSNREFYDNRLFTFPTAVMKHPDLGVHWREITDGVYDYSKSRTNENEAKAVVEEVVRRLRNKEEAKYSLGVVTFSIAQQRLIENMLDEARSKYAEIDPYFTAVEEPVFIKNLETVQGDERDVILFSICYGPDITGTVRMNFGPLNNKGGERRLNVAITRARKQLLVFSKLKPEDIDLSRTKATGVKSLKAFLDYARRGTISVEAESTKTKGIETAPLELSIMNELAKRGYKVDKQVGCSDYRIDLAICDPKDTDSYILGIECDGLNYSNAKSARDREVIRKNILEGLGWNLHRVWSTEWWLRRPVEISKIEEALAKAKSRNSIIYNDLKKSNKTTAVAVDTMEMDVRNSVRNIVSKEINKDPEAANECDSGQSIYHKYKLQGRAYSGEIHDVDNYRRVCDLVKSIVEYESPILLDTLATRVTNCWGLQKTGSRIREVISHAVKHHKYILRHYDDRSFIWTKNLAEKPYEIFRIPEINDAKPRQAIEICPEEMANAAIHVLSLHISIGYEDLAREAAILFNIHRLGSNVRSYFEMGIDLMKKKGVCRVEGDRFILL